MVTNHAFGFYSETEEPNRVGDFSPSPGNRVSVRRLPLFAVGNTTVSSSVVGFGPTLTFSGAGGISVGMTGNTVIVSGASTGGISAIGTTTGTTSSQAFTISSGSTLSAGGAASVGFSGGTVVVSAPTTSVSLSQFEPILFGSNFGLFSIALGSLLAQPIEIPAVLSINQLDFVGGCIFSGLQQSSNVATTASALVAQTITWALYTQLTGTNSSTWTLFASTSFSIGVQDSISCSSSSQSKSQTLFYNLGGSASSTTGTTSTSSGTVNMAFMGTGFTGQFHRIDCPWATTFPPGGYVLAIGGSSAITLAGTGAMSLNVLNSIYGITASTATSNYFAPAGWTTTATGIGTAMFGIGSTSVVGNTAPATINPSALLVNSTQPRPYVIFRNGGS